MTDAPHLPLDAFLDAFRKDVAAAAVRPLAEYLARFPGDDVGIAFEYAAALRQNAATRSTAAGSDRVGPYQIIKELGRGGQGAVYLAKDTRLNRTVALKVLTSRASLSEHGLVRFRREAEIASKLDHPGICPVYDVGLDGDVPFIAMKVVEGETLAQTITTARERAHPDESMHVVLPETGEEPPPPTAEGTAKQLPRTHAEISRIVLLFEQTARALHAAHEHGVIHRDIKPGNIMVTPEGLPVILDFGLAQDTEADAPTLTLAGELMGTPHYMSPEQIAAHRIRLDRRTDVWSLGVALHECLTLARPFDAPTREGIYQAILGKNPPDARAVNAAIPRDLQVVIETALDKDRDRRYATALGFAEDLRRVRERQPILARPVGQLTRLLRWCQRNPALAAALIGLIVVLAAGLATSLHFLGLSDAALAGRTLALTEYDRLGDVSRLAQLTRQADELWPAAPDQAPKMKAWITRADALRQSLPGHREVLARLHESALALSDADRAADIAAHSMQRRKAAMMAERRPEMAAWLKRQPESDADSRPDSEPAPGDARQPHMLSVAEVRAELAQADAEVSALNAKISERLTWKFDGTAAQFKHDTLAQLVADLEVLVDPDPLKGTLSSVRARLAFAESVQRATVEMHRAQWAEAVRSIADTNECPKYGGLRLAPQVGLIPVGRNPQSGLWEFAQLQTAAPSARESLPTRRVDGRLDVTEDLGIVFVLVPGGTFTMGARLPDKDHPVGSPNVDPGAQPDDGPSEAVVLSPFLMSKYEMTIAQWQRLAGSNPSVSHPGSHQWGDKTVDARYPVDSVSWIECDVVLRRLGLALPTEAQWEYAARAGTTTPWWCGEASETLQYAENVADASWYSRRKPDDSRTDARCEAWNDGYEGPAPVGSFMANGFGLHDMLGNVREWCADAGNYGARRSGDGLMAPPPIVASGDFPQSRRRVLRGGSFFTAARNARSAMTDTEPRENWSFDIGVRPARRIDP